MRRYDATWTDEDHAEHEKLISESFAQHETNRERADAYRAGIEDALQAHRLWARDIEHKLLDDGYLSMWKQVSRTGTVAVVARGRKVRKPRTWSVARKDSKAALTTVDLTIEVFTRADIEAKRRSALSLRKSYDDEIQMWDALLAFLDAAGADDVPTAERLSGITLDTFLGEEAA